MAVTLAVGDYHLVKRSAAGLLAPNQSQTVMVWVYFPTYGSGRHSFVALSNAASGSAIQLGTNGVQVEAWNWGGSSLAITSASPSVGVWHHVAYVRSGSTNLLYIDGAEVDSNTNSTQTAVANTIYFNGWDGGGDAETSDASLDDFRYYNRALAPDEILTIASSRGRDSILYGLVTRFVFCERSPGSVVADAVDVVDSAGGSNDVTQRAFPYIATSFITSSSNSLAAPSSGAWLPSSSYTNRLLILLAGSEDTAGIARTLSSVTYGGRPLTKIVGASVVSGGVSAAKEAWCLNEAGLQAATSQTFGFTWDSVPNNAVGYTAVVLTSVLQSNPTPVSGTGTSIGSNAVQLGAPIAVSEKDGVLLGVICGNASSFTPPSGYNERTDFTASSTATLGSATRGIAADGFEQPTYLYNATANRQALVGFVVRGAGEILYAESSLLLARRV